MTRDAVHLVRRWAAGEPAERPGTRELTAADEPAVRELTWVAYAGTVDAFPSAAVAGAEVSECLAGAHGPMVPEASLAAEAGGRLVAAAIVIRVAQYAGVPLLAFVATDPAYRGRGLATALIETAAARLDALGSRELHLAVTRGNPAERLYRALGFQDG